MAIFVGVFNLAPDRPRSDLRVDAPRLCLKRLAPPLAAVAAASTAWASPPPPGHEPDAVRARPAAFCAGMVAVAVALVSPLDGRPPLALGPHGAARPPHLGGRAAARPRPAPAVVVRSRVAPPLPAIRRPACGRSSSPPPASRSSTLLAWHVPALYDAALDHDAVHGARAPHASSPRRSPCGPRSTPSTASRPASPSWPLFLVSFPPLLLGGAMTFATPVGTRPTPRIRRRHCTDQQLAGVVMWAYGGLAAVVGRRLPLRPLAARPRAVPAPAGPRRSPHSAVDAGPSC